MALIVQCVNLTIMDQSVLNVFAQYTECVMMEPPGLVFVLVSQAGAGLFVMLLFVLHHVFMEHAQHQIPAHVNPDGVEHFVM